MKDIVQVHGLPKFAFIQPVVERITDCLSSNSSVQVHILGGKKFFRLRVTLNIPKSLYRWIPMSFPMHRLVYAKIRYEKLSFICYTYSRIEHTVNACSSPPLELHEVEVPFFFRYLRLAFHWEHGQFTVASAYHLAMDTLAWSHHGINPSMTWSIWVPLESLWN